MSAQAIPLSPDDDLAEYYADPLGFVLWAFPWGEVGPMEHESGPDYWQRVFLDDLGRLVRDRGFDGNTPVEPIRMAIASGHGIGKSTLFAMVFWWMMCTRPNTKGRVTANTFPQLEVTTWAEIRKWWEMLPPTCKCRFEVTGSKAYAVAAPTKHFAHPLTCAEENSEAFAGQHNKSSTSFFMFDEASLIPDIIFDVAEAGLTDGEPMWFVAGNPTRNVGAFYEVCFGTRKHRWNVRSIDSRDCKFPNHALHDEWIQDHGIDSDYVRVRIMGQPPQQSEEQLIGKDLVQEAQKRNVAELPDTPLVAGVDVPDGGSAWFVVRFRRGLDSIPGSLVPRPIRVAGSRIDRETMIARLASILAETGRNKVAMMFVDSAFGSPIVERLHVLGFDNVQEISFGGKSPDPHFANMRAFMWGKAMKDWLGKGAIDPEDKKLAVDLTGPGFKFRVGGDGALVVESKDDMRKRDVPSPDDGDALALTFARPVAPQTARPDPRLGKKYRAPGSRGDSDGWMG